jgi:branched-chain amino acid transport system substrate-binding protein
LTEPDEDRTATERRRRRNEQLKLTAGSVDPLSTVVMGGAALAPIIQHDVKRGWEIFGWIVVAVAMQTRNGIGIGSSNAIRRMRRLIALVLLFLIAAAPPSAHAQVKIGFITTLSGPGGYLGEDLRDGFALAVSQGGIPMQILVEDDGLKPAAARQIAERMLKSQGIRIFTGVVFSNVAVAMLGDVLDAGAYFLGPNTSPNDFAGAQCDPHYFVTGWDETLHASAGVLANQLGKHSIFLLAPNYLTGKQVIAAVKGTFAGRVAGEVYTGLDQTDFSAEIAEIRDAHPDAIYEFEPGGLGINFLKQFSATGLSDSVTLTVAAPSLDSRILAAVGDAALPIRVVADWNADFDNPANQEFVSDFEKTYHRLPTYYAAHGYDTARLIASALKASGGIVDDPFRAALKRADFASVRGNFAFASNHGPLLDWYELQPIRGADGTLHLQTQRKIRSHAGGAYAERCPMH